MSKEELIEMVNATINENGKREITGKSLNLALMQIIEAMGESGGGAGGVTIYFNQGNETDEQKAHNAEVFAQLKALQEAGKPLPPLGVDVTGPMLAGVAPEGTDLSRIGVIMYPNPFFSLDLDGVLLGAGTPSLQIAVVNEVISIQFYVFEDGTVSTEAPASTMSLNL